MTDQEIKDAIRSFIKSWAAGDVKNALSFFAEDGVWTGPQGTFKGISQIEKFLTWVIGITKDYHATETGIGIITQGDMGVIEHDLYGTVNGMKGVVPTACIYEFKNGKIANVRVYQDRLTLAQQATKGISKWIVNMVVKGSKRGLQ
jgi:ketosteroid isomerase-like protein